MVRCGNTPVDIEAAQEELEQFRAVRAGLMVDFKPESTIEREPVNRLGGLRWRLRRVSVMAVSLSSSKA